MKNVKAILASALVAAGLGLSAKATTINDIFTGVDLNGAEITFKYKNYDMGKIYTDSTMTTYGNSEFVDVNDLSGLELEGGTDVSFAASDSWGIFRVTSVIVVADNGIEYDWNPTSGVITVTNPNSTTSSYSSSVSGVEMTGLFWGEQDLTMGTEILQGDTYTTIEGSSMSYALFLDDSADFQFSAAPGDIVASVNSAIDGDVVMTGVSESFYTQYTLDSSNQIEDGLFSGGSSAGNLVALDTDTGGSDNVNLNGSWNSDLDSNLYGDPATLDFSISFQTKPGQAGWTSTSEDPLVVTAIPTPTAVWGGVIMAGFVGMNVIRRRRAE